MRKRRTDLKLKECFLFAIDSPKDLARRLSTKSHRLTVEDLKNLSADAGNFKLYKIKDRPIQEPKARLQAIHLRVHRPVHIVIAMPHTHGDDAAEKIQVLIALRIPHILILRVRHHHRLLEIMKHRGK